MPLLLRNIFSVLLLQPARFVEPAPRTMGVWIFVSLFLSTLVCLQFPPQRLELAVIPIVMSLITWPWARKWGSPGVGRPLFTLAWCLPVTLGISHLANNPLIDMLASGYLFAALTLQSRADVGPEEISGRDRQELVQARAALGEAHSAPTGLTNQGAVTLVEFGPVIARWKDRDIHEWLLDAEGRTWEFQGTADMQSSLAALSARQMLVTPGAIYELA